MKALWKDLREALLSLAPVVVLGLAMQLLTGFMTLELFIRWIAGSLFAAAGLFLFLRGVEYCLIPLGDMLGTRLPLSPGLAALLLMAFTLGLCANTADPAVTVLTGHVATVSTGQGPPPWLIIAAVVSGVGLFLALALLRIVLGLPARLILGAAYTLTLLLAFFVPPSFVALGLDSGGVATGPLTVPFLLSIGMGFVSVLAGKNASSDGFGVLGLVALGPITGVMLLGALW